MKFPTIIKAPASLLFSFILLLAGCRSVYVPHKADYGNYRITPATGKDSSLNAMMTPYRDSVTRSMSQVIGYLPERLEKKAPGGSLGKFMTDALFHAAQTKFGITPDIAVMNYGGIRLNELPAGAITRGRIFELMPFDNLVVIQKVKGDALQQFLDIAAEKGGWPFTGLQMEIQDRKAVHVMIGGQPLDPNKVYTMVNSDYLANGGDNANMLKALPQQNIGYLMRDAFMEYVKVLEARSKK